MNGSQSPIVGFVGVGQIGRPMADCIIANFDTVVCNRSPEKLEHFRDRAGIAATPQELATRCDIIVGCLPAAQDYRQVVFGPRGLLEGGRARIFVHVGTTGSAILREMETAFAERGVSVLDAPVTGGPSRAARRDLVSMVSGAEDVLDRARPVIECYSSKIVYFGTRLGSAQTMKLVNNLIMIANTILTSEAFVMGVKGGLDPDKMIDVLNGGTAQSYVTSELFPSQVLNGNFHFGGRLEMGAKDYNCVMEEARALGASVSVAEAARRTLLDALADQGPAADITSVVKYLGKIAGIEFPQTRTAPVTR